MDKIRGFEVARGWEDKGINLPKRQTKNAAGYDFEAAETVRISPLSFALETMKDLFKDLAEGIATVFDEDGIEEDLVKEVLHFVDYMEAVDENELVQGEATLRILEIADKVLSGKGIDVHEAYEERFKQLKPTLVPTGVKAYMLEDEKLDLYNRSSNPMKNFLVLSNGVGLIDSDYYENEDNDGHIMFQFLNLGHEDIVINKGDRIGQGVFTKFLKVDNDVEGGVRTGGFGSTAK